MTESAKKKRHALVWCLREIDGKTFSQIAKVINRCKEVAYQDYLRSLRMKEKGLI